MQSFSPFEEDQRPRFLPPAHYWMPWLGLLAVLGVAALFVAAWIFTGSFEERIRGVPSRVYSDTFLIHPGQRYTPEEFQTKLRRLGYKEVDSRPQYSGHYRRSRNSFECNLRSFHHPVTPLAARRVQVRFARGSVDSLRDLDAGRRLDVLEIEPEQVAAFYSEIREERILTNLEDLPEHLVDAILVTEDQRFFSHHGIDLLAIARAAGANVRAMGVVQGGSTLTQQLIKNVYLRPERTLTRKMLEAILAVLLELRYDKEEILNAYINEVYLGQKGAIAITGFGEAARFYFGKDLRDLDLAESALLVGMIRAPGKYNPYIRPERALDRRRQILSVMLEHGKIAPEQFEEAAERPVDLLRDHDLGNRAPYFLDFLQAQLSSLVPEKTLREGGLRVFTSLDLGIQSHAENALRSGLELLEKTVGEKLGLDEDPEHADKLQGCVIALRPLTGHVVAMVGGRNYAGSQFNRAVQAHRQPGSLIKPFVYMTGFARAQRKEIPPFTAASLLEDEPLQMVSGGELWEPSNYGGKFNGVVTVREALQRSLNIPAVRAARHIGLRAVIQSLRELGLEGRLLPVPSLALGVFEVTPLEMASAFSAIANYGVKARSLSIREVVAPDGEVLESHHVELRPVVSPQAAYLTLALMRGVVAQGTAVRLRGLGYRGEVAAKTGTTDDLRDAWFVGFTPRLLVLVWVGYDDNRPIGLSGSEAALPIWAELMRRLPSESSGRFREPEGLTWEEIDPGSGQVATWRCRDRRAELFIEGTQPRERCEVHSSGWAAGFWDRIR